jgi:GTP-binding protein EngB required for normal cell division
MTLINESCIERQRNTNNDPPEPKFLLEWYATMARPFLQQNAPDCVASLDADRQRLCKLLSRSETITVCFLGHSGVGKSTLINALVASDSQLLPSGGIGPLTALATEVNYAEIPMFRAQYHGRDRVGRLIFALERKLARSGISLTESVLKEAAALIDDETVAELDVDEQNQGVAESPANDRIAAYIKQASQIITGDQFSKRSLEYLTHALRVACDLTPRAGIQLDTEDEVRVARVKEALKKRTMEIHQASHGSEFARELKDHAAGFLAPLIERISVGWPSALLSSGVVLVDLPGVGIAQDSYRQVSKSYVRDKARAVVLVVDRAGPTADTVELLRSTGYWDRMVGAVDDPEADRCSILIAVTKVDDVAAEEWRNAADNRQGKRKRDFFG